MNFAQCAELMRCRGGEADIADGFGVGEAEVADGDGVAQSKE
jgi:hypothetical protein